MAYIGPSPSIQTTGARPLDQFAADGTQTTFPLTQGVPGNYESNALVVVENVPQQPGDSFTIVDTYTITFSSGTGTFVVNETVTGGTSGATGRVIKVNALSIVVEKLTGTFNSTETFTGGTSSASKTASFFVQNYGGGLKFSEAPALGAVIYVVHQGLTTYNMVPAAGSVGATQLDPALRTFTRDQFTGNGSNTQFSLSDTPYDINSIIVISDGIVQTKTTNFTLSGSTLTFTSAPDNNADIQVIHMGFSSGIKLVTVADGAITTGKLADLAVSNAKVDDNAITTAKIANGAVVASKFDVISGANGTGAMTPPGGTTAQRPAANVAANGMRRYNSSLGREEYYLNTFWVNNDPATFTGKTKVTFGYTGSGQNWTVPAGVNYIYVKMWGAGGGGGSQSGWNFGSPGGGGGHTRGIVSVTPGQTIAMVVGFGGQAVDSTNAYGGGGSRSSSGSYCAGGGGYTAIFDGSINAGNQVMVAGGGGGGGASRAGAGNFGGGGGGLIGQDGSAQYDGYYAYRGRGGTQSAGGSGGGTSGAAFQGGQGSAYGGGGGGGWYGGSGGAYIEDDTMGGGGGGSGYIHPSRVLLGETYTASFATPAFFWDPDLQGFAPGHGTPTAMGAQTAGNNQGGTGGTGCIVIYY